MQFPESKCREARKPFKKQSIFARELQTKTAVRHYFKFIRLALKKKKRRIALLASMDVIEVLFS